MEKKDAARILYFQGKSIREVANVLTLNKNTVSKWYQRGDWKNKKISFDLHKISNTEITLDLIAYQLKTLQQIKDDYIDSGELKLLERGDIDALQKLHTTIKYEHKKFEHYVGVMKEFMSFLKEYDNSLAKLLVDASNVFLNERRKAL